MSTIHRNTVVAILGWLGAHQKALLRYESLYIKMGVPQTSICTMIAPPYTIVKTILAANEPIIIPDGWPHRDNLTERYDTTQAIAWKLLRYVHNNKDCEKLYIHAFSNGGCFVWEKIRQILCLSLNNQTNNQKNRNDIVKIKSDSSSDDAASRAETMDILSSIRGKLKGVIFDSCPIADLYKLPDALQLCTMKQRTAVVRHCGYEYLNMTTHPAVKEKVQKRIYSFINGLLYDPLSVQQLYLYSRNDELAPADFIEKFIEQRNKFLNEPIPTISSLTWKNSKHCAHFNEYPLDYHNSIARFLQQDDKVIKTAQDRLNVRIPSKL